MRSAARPSWMRASFHVAALVALIPAGLKAWSCEEAQQPGEPLVYSTGIGELRRVVLGQHTVANLNTRTFVSVRLTSHACDIQLKSGEALFEIRRNDAHTVYVTAGSVRMDSNAAAFSVRLHDNEHVDVLVRKGDVTLTSMRKDVTLTANEKARIAPHGVALERLDEAEMQRRLQWTTGYLSFSGETLEEVVAEFNRYNEQRLVVEDRAIRNLRIGGNYQSTDPEGFVAALRPMGVERADSDPVDTSPRLIRLVGAQTH